MQHANAHNALEIELCRHQTVARTGLTQNALEHQAPTPQRSGLYFVPETLLGLMWLQFAQASRLSCSNAGRLKLYYGRKLEARRLRQEGLTLIQIAQRLKVDRKSVRS